MNDLTVGITAGVLTAASTLPQIVKTIRTRDSRNVSVVMFCVLLAGVVTWTWYGFMKEDWPIILTNAFSSLANMFMLFLKWKYR